MEGRREEEREGKEGGEGGLKETKRGREGEKIRQRVSGLSFTSKEVET